MLDDTPQSPLPLIGISRATFCTTNNITGVDWEVIRAFRDILYVQSTFRFVYLASATDQLDEVRLLQELGMRFSLIQKVHIGNAPSERDAIQLINSTGITHAPEICRLLKISNRISYTGTRIGLVSGLSSFSLSGTPYSPSVLSNFVIQFSHLQD